MSLDEHIVDMIRDRFDKVDKDNTELLTCFKEHVEKDAEYWKKIDSASAQVGIIKYLSGGAIGAAVLDWLYNRFGPH